MILLALGGHLAMRAKYQQRLKTLVKLTDAVASRCLVMLWYSLLWRDPCIVGEADAKQVTQVN